MKWKGLEWKQSWDGICLKGVKKNMKKTSVTIADDMTHITS
jgi:hypothetical protein